MYENIVTKTIPIEERHRQLKFVENVSVRVIVEQDLKWLYSSVKMKNNPESDIGWFARIDVKIIKDNKISNEIFSILNSSTLVIKIAEITNRNNLTSLKGKSLIITKSKIEGKIGWNVDLIEE